MGHYIMESIPASTQVVLDSFIEEVGERYNAELWIESTNYNHEHRGFDIHIGGDRDVVNILILKVINWQSTRLGALDVYVSLYHSGENNLEGV